MAKAFGAESSMTQTRGGGRPPARRISSTTFMSWRYRSGGFARSISRAPLVAMTSASPAKKVPTLIVVATATAMADTAPAEAVTR